MKGAILYGILPCQSLKIAFFFKITHTLLMCISDGKKAAYTSIHMDPACGVCSTLLALKICSHFQPAQLQNFKQDEARIVERYPSSLHYNAILIQLLISFTHFRFVIKNKFMWFNSHVQRAISFYCMWRPPQFKRQFLQFLLPPSESRSAPNL